MKMKKEDLTREELAEAAEDLNKVLDLNPKIVVEFESNLKGAALKAVEKKFVSQLEKDVVEAATLIAPTDVLEVKTVDVLTVLGVDSISTKSVGDMTSPAVTSPVREKQGLEPSKKKEEKEKKGGEEKMAEKSKKKVSAPPKSKKAAEAKASIKGVEKNEFGFRVKTKSDEAIKSIASGKTTLKDVKKKFDMLSFGKLIKDLEDRGFRIKETKEGLTSIVKK